MEPAKALSADSKGFIQFRLKKITRSLRDTLQLLGYSLLLSHLTFIPYAHAGPTGGTVVGGTGSISQADLTTTINQTTDSLAIDWQTFDVNVDERVQFIQPDVSSIALNRVLSNQQSEIHGQIDANGQVILVNPHGVFFSGTAVVNVAGIIASGLDIKTSDFMNGDYIFSEVLGTEGTVINSGTINAATGGSVSLLGKQVVNDGLISANLGMVNLAAGKEAIVSFDNNGLFGIKVTREILQDELGLDPAVLNSGDINAAGGKVLITGSVSRDIFSSAVNTGDLEQATSVVANGDGTFSLGGGADVLNTGSINVSTTEGDAGQVVMLGENVTSSGEIRADAVNGKGGDIELHARNITELTGQSITSARAELSGNGGSIMLLGDKVGLLDNSSVDVSGANGGGTALIGGDREGENASVRNASFVYLNNNANVMADALDEGDGGKLITFAEDTARIHGKLYARGGVNGGDGGFIETSGKRGFEIIYAPDVSAVNGDGGLWLIDPYNITIQNGDGSNDTDFVETTSPAPETIYTSTSDTAIIETGTIFAALLNGDVSIVTDDDPATTELDGDITFGTDVLLDYDGIGVGTNRTLTLDASNDILFRDGSKIFDGSPGNESLHVSLQAGGSVQIGETNGSTALINTRGGNFTVGTTLNPVASFTNYGTITTEGSLTKAAGDISVTSSGDILTTGLNARGGGGIQTSTDNAGQDGGDITLHAGGAITVNGDLNTYGSQAKYSNNNGGKTGGAGGNVSVVSTSTLATDVVLVHAINTSGGQGDGDGNEPGDGGMAGTIDLDGAAITLNGNLTASGGAPDANNGSWGDGNTITIDGPTSLAANIIIDTDTSTDNLSGGQIVINNTIVADEAVKDRTLTLDAGNSSISINSTLGSDTNALNTFTIEAADTASLDAINTRSGGISITANTINLGGDLNTARALTAGSVSINGEAFLDGNVSITTNSTNDDSVSFSAGINDDVAATAHTLVIDAGTGAINLNSIGDITGQEIQELTITSSETTTVTGTIDTLSGGVDITAGTRIDLNADINTNHAADGGAVRFNGAVSLNDNISINTNSITSDGDITFESTVDADAVGNNRTLTLTADTADVSINGAVGSSDALQKLTISSANLASIDAVTTRSGGIDIAATGVDLGGNISTDDTDDGGAVVIDTNSIDLSANVAIDTVSSNSDGIVDITGDIEANDAASKRTLSIDSDTQTISIKGDIGANRALQSFDIIDSNGGSNISVTDLDAIHTRDGGISIISQDIELAGNISTNDIATTAGSVEFNGNVSLGANVFIDTTGSTTSGSVTFNNNVNADAVASNRILRIDAGTGNVDFLGSVGNEEHLNALQVINSATTNLIKVDTLEGGIDVRGTSIVLNGDIDTDNSTSTNSGNVIFNGVVTLADNTVRIDTNEAGIDGSVTFNNNIITDGTARSLEILSGAGTVTMQDVGTNAVGQALQGITVNNSATITSPGTITVGNVHTEDGGIQFNAAGSGTVTLNGNLNTTVDGNAGIIDITGAVELGASNINLLTNGSGSSSTIDIRGTINADDTDNQRSLTINSGDSITTITGEIGVNDAIESLTINTGSANTNINAINTRDGGVNITSSQINLDGNISTDFGTNSGSVTLSGITNLTNNVVIDTDHDGSGNDGSVTFNERIIADSTASNRSLEIVAGSGAISVNDIVGQTDRYLQSFKVTSASALNLSNTVHTAGAIDLTATNINLFNNLDSTFGANAGAIAMTGAVNLNNTDILINSTSSVGTDNGVTVNGDVNNASTTFDSNLIITAGNGSIELDQIGVVNGALGNVEMSGNSITVGAINTTVSGGTQGNINLTATNGIQLNGDLKTIESGTAGAINLNGDVTLGNSISLITDAVTADNYVSIDGTINADLNTSNRSLTVTTGDGDATFLGDIGTAANGALYRTTINSLGGNINIGNITTRNGGIYLNGNVINVGGNLDSTDLATSSGVIQFQSNDIQLTDNLNINTDISGTLDGYFYIYSPNSATPLVTGNNFSITSNTGSGGFYWFNTGATALSSFDIQSSGYSYISGVDVNTGGSLTVNSSNGIYLSGNYITNNADITFNADSDANGYGILTRYSTYPAVTITSTNADTLIIAADVDLLDLSQPEPPIDVSISANTVNITSTGDMSLGSATGGLTLDQTELDSINATNLAFNASNNITSNGVVLTDDVVMSTASGNIAFTGTESSFNSLIATSAENVDLSTNITTTNAMSLTGVNIDVVSDSVLSSSTSGITLAGNITGASILTINSVTDTNVQNATFSGGLSDLIIDTATLTTDPGDTISTANNINLTVHENTNHIQDYNLVSNNGSVSITTTNANLIMDSNTYINSMGNINITSNTGNVSLSEANSTSGTVTVAANNGSIADNNGGVNNITANSVVLTASTGIGSSNSIETRAAELDVINSTSGTVDIVNSGAVTLSHLNNEGDINFENTGTVTINEIDANYDIGQLTLTVHNGSVYGIDRPGIDFTTVPDITANRALITVDESFGDFDRPIVLKIQSEFVLASVFSSTFFYGSPPPIVTNNADIQASVFDAIGSISGQQLIDVESLADIDPAIFTQIRNYNQDDIAIRLPRDQLYEDELE